MRTWDFYLSGEEVVSNAWGSEVPQQSAIDTDLLEGLLRTPNPSTAIWRSRCH